MLVGRGQTLLFTSCMSILGLQGMRDWKHASDFPCWCPGASHSVVILPCECGSRDYNAYFSCSVCKLRAHYFTCPVLELGGQCVLQQMPRLVHFKGYYAYARSCPHSLVTLEPHPMLEAAPL